MTDYQIIQPQGELRHLVKYFWALNIRHLSGPLTIRTFVDDSSGIIFHHHNHQSAVKRGGEYLPQSIIYGQATQPSVAEVNTPFSAVGVLFQPQTIQRLFGIDAVYFSDRIYSLNDFKKELPINIQLHDAGNNAERLDILSRFLLKKAADARDEDSLVSECIRRIKSNMVHQVKELVDLSGVSERQLQRRFITSVGVSPRHYLKLAKFETVVKLLRQDMDIKFTEMAHDLEFADQPHFNRTIRNLSGLNPRELKGRLKEELVNLIIQDPAFKTQPLSSDDASSGKPNGYLAA